MISFFSSKNSNILFPYIKRGWDKSPWPRLIFLSQIKKSF
ncbi:hypothetical protein STRMA_1482 [Streptococcus macacae NCTC 11558]|uniref:Uncharacterized protein n=1 Tax=Streptococcus macacae NCTC 11558 TaxID=764298 RepID=G5JW69_9STRE|nr:hypothetical protein STRMA_1482 [Streptococcus macacae NCTC 11558]